MMTYIQYYQCYSNIYALVEILDNFEYHHLQNNFYLENNLNQLFCLVLLFIQSFLLLLLFFLSKSALFMNRAIADLSTEPSLFI